MPTFMATHSEGPGTGINMVLSEKFRGTACDYGYKQTDIYIYIYMDVLDPMDIGYSLAKVANCNITIFKFGKS